MSNSHINVSGPVEIPSIEVADTVQHSTASAGLCLRFCTRESRRRRLLRTGGHAALMLLVNSALARSTVLACSSFALLALALMVGIAGLDTTLMVTDVSVSGNR